MTCALPWNIAAQPPITTKSTLASQSCWMTRSKFMLRLGGLASRGLGGYGQTVHASSSLRRRQLDLLNQQRDIDPELTGGLHLSTRFRIPQSLDRTGQGLTG